MEPRDCRINPMTGEIEMRFGQDTAGPRNSFDSLIGGAA